MSKQFNKIGAGGGIVNQFTGAKPVQNNQAKKEKPTSQAQKKQPTTKKVGRPKERGEVFRINLAVDIEHKEFLKEQAWKEKKTVTELLNDLIKDYKERVDG